MRTYILKQAMLFVSAALMMGVFMYVLTVVCVGSGMVAIHASKLMVALILIAGMQNIGEHLCACQDIDVMCFHLSMNKLKIL